MPSGYEILGWDEISGEQLVSGEADADEEVDALLGAAARRTKNPAMKQAIANRLANRGAVISQKQPRASRRLVIGIDTGAVAVAAGAAGVFTVVPQWPMKVERIVISPACAPNFLFNNIRVGTLSQFAAGTPVPADIFVPGSVDCMLKGDTCQTGLALIIDYVNISAAASRLTGGIVGEVIQF